MLEDKKKQNDEEITKKFEELINQTGHSLEDKVERVLRKYAWSYRRGAHYLDLDGKNDRQIDFFVSMPSVKIPREVSNHVFVQLELTIECKNLPDHAWIFSGRNKTSLKPEYAFTDNPIKNKDLIQAIPYIDKKNFSANSYSEKFLPTSATKGESKSNKKDNNLYEAIVQVTKASRYRQIFLIDRFNQAQNLNKSIPQELNIFQSVIIFQGRMYKTNLIDDKIKLEPINFACVEKEFLSENYHEVNGEIHIVSYDWFLDYLELIKSTYGLPPPYENFVQAFELDTDRKPYL